MDGFTYIVQYWININKYPSSLINNSWII